MKSLLINPKTKTMTEVELKSPNTSLKDVREILNCRMIGRTEIRLKYILLFDGSALSDGRFSDGKFRIESRKLSILGPCLVLCRRGMGVLQKFDGNVEEIKKLIKWED